MEKLSLSKVRRRQRRISVFDGQDLKKAILAGASWLEETSQAINALNVFPVPDGGHGLNMAATMKSAIRILSTATKPQQALIAAKVAHDALLGARGNFRSHPSRKHYVGLLRD